MGELLNGELSRRVLILEVMSEPRPPFQTTTPNLLC